MPSKAEVRGLIDLLEKWDEQYWEDNEDDPEASDDAAREIAELTGTVLECLNDYLQRCF